MIRATKPLSLKDLSSPNQGQCKRWIVPGCRRNQMTQALVRFLTSAKEVTGKMVQNHAFLSLMAVVCLAFQVRQGHKQGQVPAGDKSRLPIDRLIWTIVIGSKILSEIEKRLVTQICRCIYGS
jgi:hypothetical protein